MSGVIERDAGLASAIAAAGGVRPLARRLGWSHQRLCRLRSAPRAHLFAIAQAAGVEPETVRPDLADWIARETRHRWMEKARARFAINSGLGGGAATVRRAPRAEAQTLDLLDLGLITAALRFAAAERGLGLVEIMAAPRGGVGTASAAQSARAYGMALAVVVGRVGSEAVAGVVGVSRQAVDAAAERYLRRREGDDPDEGAKVLERGRPRLAKAAEPGLWDAERRFVAQLAGEA